MVDTGAPDERRRRGSRAVEAVWLAKASTGGRRKIRRPIVRTIRQPPSAVPSVSAARRRPSPRAAPRTSSTAVGEQQRGDHAHRLLRVVGAVAERERGGHRPLCRAHRASDRTGRAPQEPPIERASAKPPHEAEHRRDGQRDQHAEDADRLPAVEAAPVDRVGCPASTSAAPTSPPTSACPELEGSPRHQVSRFQRVAARTPAPITATASAGATVTMPAIVSATAVPDEQRAEHVEDRRERDRLAGPCAACRDERRDRVRRRRGTRSSARTRARTRPRARGP